jgi:tRNA(Ile)-lysidine synthase
LQSDLQNKIDNAPWLVANATVSRMWFLGEPIAVQRRLVKAIGERAGIPLEFKHVEEILHFAAEEGSSGKELSLPLGWKLLRDADELAFLTPDLRGPAEPQNDYAYELPIPGRVAVHETGLSLELTLIPAERISAEQAAGYNPDQLLDAASLPGPLTVRNWRPGDRFWPAHTKSPKKIKELLSERHVAQAQRKLWPVIATGTTTGNARGNEIIWLRGFPSPAKYKAKPGQEALLILETPLDPKPT